MSDNETYYRNYQVAVGLNANYYRKLKKQAEINFNGKLSTMAAKIIKMAFDGK